MFATDQKFKPRRKDVWDTIHTPLELLELMEEQGFLSAENTWFLQYLLYRINNRPLYKRVFDFMANRSRLLKTLYVYDPPEIPLGKFTAINLISNVLFVDFK